MYSIDELTLYLLDLRRKQPIPSKTIILAEFALQLEFVRLSQVTNDPKWERLGNQVIEKISKAQTPLDGLYSIFWNVDTFQPSNRRRCRLCSVQQSTHSLE